MAKSEIDWQANEALMAQGVSRRERARQLNVSESTLRNAETRRALEAQGTPVPMRVPQEATISDLQHLLQEQESRLMAYVDQRIQEIIEHQQQQAGPLHLPQQRLQVPMGIPVPQYPDDPQRDTRLNLHLAAGEAWEIRVLGTAFGMTPSHLIRQLWQAFRVSPQAKQALQQALDSERTQGVLEGPLTGTPEEDV